MRFQNIRHRLTFSIILFVALLLITIAVGVYAYFRHTTTELIHSQQFSMVSITAKGLDDKIKSSHNALIAIAKIVPHDQFADRPAIQNWLNNRKGTQTVFNHGFFLLDAGGNLIVSTSSLRHENAEYFRQLFAKSSGSGWQYVSTPVICSANQHPVILMTAPVRDSSGAVRGLLCGAIDLLQKDSFFNEIAQARLGSSGYMYLFSTDRTMVLHKDTSRIGKKDIPPGANKMYDRAIAGHEGSGDNINSRGVRYLTSVKRLESTGWILGANYPYVEAMQPITRFRNVLFPAIALVLLAACFMARMLGAALARPLSDLTIQVQKLSQPGADREQSLSSAEKGEIGALTDSFNALLHEVRTREEEQRIMTNILEAEIAERQKSEEELEQQKIALLENEKRLTENNDQLLATEEMLRVQIGEYEISQEALKESNERFRALHEASFGGLFVQENGIILDCNQGLSDMTGYTMEELIGMKSIELVPVDYHDEVIRKIQEGFAESYEVEGVRKDGTRYHVKIRGKSIFYLGRSVRVTDFRDITERKHAEEERQRMEQQFHHAQKLESLGVLAGGIAHDFNNILTVIVGHCFMGREISHSEPEYHARFDGIENAAHRAANLCRQMLTYAGKSPLEQTRINLRQLVDEIVNMLQSAIRKNVTIELDTKSNVPKIIGDNAQIQQIVMNLIINAADAIGEKNGVIMLSITKTVITGKNEQYDYFDCDIPIGDYCTLEVSDSGCGMDEATRKRLFEPFFTTKFTGRGLGMSAILGIVKAHGGALQLSSEPGVGTTFKVFFPLPDAQTSASSAISEYTDDLTPLSGTVLLVEDEEILQIVATEVLESIGFTVVTADNGLEALEIYNGRKGEIDLVLLDLIMPVMGGVEAYHKLREISPTVPVVICSGYDVEEIESTIELDENTRFVRKPYRPEVLRIALAEMLKR